jgi:hypothetical protein
MSDSLTQHAQGWTDALVPLLKRQPNPKPKI